MKECKKCSVSKPLEEYPKSKSCKDGHSGKCKICTSVYKKKNKETRKVVCNTCDINKHGYDAAMCKSCSSKDVHKREHNVITKECTACSDSFEDNSLMKRKIFCSKKCQENEWYENNKDDLVDRYRETRQKHRELYPEIYQARDAKRRAAKLNAILPGFDEEIKEIYANNPEGNEVHHIIPLQEHNDKVSGLHVPWNLVSLSKKKHLEAHEELRKIFKVLST